ncbi:diacylglycerol kinase [Marinobacterium sp. MBR-109]|jgi:diacylglycerol kinase (ATP)|uniref:diacylglycerol kinase n=1 Tax=Marinobacterium sp. MBR-109 TaxID=3156462 RepID=UPI0033968570
MIVTKATGLARFYYATRYSIKGLRAAYRSEPAFRYELWAAALLLPLAFWLAQSGLQLGLLISTLLFVLIMELINTAIEAVVDRAGTEFHALAGLAKDLGSAAVLLSLLITAVVWGGIAWDNFS